MERVADVIMDDVLSWLDVFDASRGVGRVCNRLRTAMKRRHSRMIELHLDSTRWDRVLREPVFAPVVEQWTKQLRRLTIQNQLWSTGLWSLLSSQSRHLQEVRIRTKLDSSLSDGMATWLHTAVAHKTLVEIHARVQAVQWHCMLLGCQQLREVNILMSQISQMPLLHDALHYLPPTLQVLRFAHTNHDVQWKEQTGALLAKRIQSGHLHSVALRFRNLTATWQAGALMSTIRGPETMVTPWLLAMPVELRTAAVDCYPFITGGGAREALLANRPRALLLNSRHLSHWFPTFPFNEWPSVRSACISVADYRHVDSTPLGKYMPQLRELVLAFPQQHPDGRWCCGAWPSSLVVIHLRIGRTEPLVDEDPIMEILYGCDTHVIWTQLRTMPHFEHLFIDLDRDPKSTVQLDWKTLQVHTTGGCPSWPTRLARIAQLEQQARSHGS
jgi:hypothetical protein